MTTLFEDKFHCHKCKLQLYYDEELAAGVCIFCNPHILETKP